MTNDDDIPSSKKKVCELSHAILCVLQERFLPNFVNQRVGPIHKSLKDLLLSSSLRYLDFDGCWDQHACCYTNFLTANELTRAGVFASPCATIFKEVPVPVLQEPKQLLLFCQWGDLSGYAILCYKPSANLTFGWLFFRLPELTNGCAINISYAPLFAWGLGTQWLNYNWPLIFIACSYCYIVFKRRQHQQQRAKVAPSASRASKNESRMHDADGETIHAHPQDRTEKPRSSSSHPFLILTALTFSFLANYTPSQVFYTAIYDIDPKKLTVLFRVGSVLHDLQAALDPIFFAVAMDDVRSAFQRLCGKSIIR